MKLHKMIEMYLKYDNMYTNGIINAFICINNHVNSCINCMLSMCRIDATCAVVHIIRSRWLAHEVPNGSLPHQRYLPILTKINFQKIFNFF